MQDGELLIFFLFSFAAKFAIISVSIQKGIFVMIEVSHLSKRFGKHLAVDDLSFSIEKGEVIGLLGPNGAGKSTTMNILTGYLSSTEGSVSIDGIDILSDPIAAKKKIGYLPEIPPLYTEMTVYEYLSFVCDLKGVKKHARQQIEEVCRLVKIDHVAHRLIKNLSKGYRQRVGLAQALINAPALLVLDEPTVGLDPKEIIEIRNLIRRIGRNHTVILSSHILSEIQSVCDRILVINRGRLVAFDSPEHLYRSLSLGGSLSLRLIAGKEQAEAALSGIPGVARVECVGENEPGSLDFTVVSDKTSDIRRPVSEALIRAGIPVLSFRGTDLSLEDVFLRLTDESAPQKED